MPVELWVAVWLDTHVDINAWPVCTSRLQQLKFTVFQQGEVDNVGKLTQVQDAHVFALSLLHGWGWDNRLLPRSSETLGGIDVLIILGDLACPLITWPYKTVSWLQTCIRDTSWWNQWLSQALMIAERSFRYLKGRQKCLLKQNHPCQPHNPLPTVLHNLCEMIFDSMRKQRKSRWSWLSGETISRREQREVVFAFEDMAR